jgi:hypothetical protein
VNIFNQGRHGETRPGEIFLPPRITYRRPVLFQGTFRRRPAKPRHVAGGISGGESGSSLLGISRPATPPRWFPHNRSERIEQSPAQAGPARRNRPDARAPSLSAAGKLAPAPPDCHRIRLRLDITNRCKGEVDSVCGNGARSTFRDSN